MALEKFPQVFFYPADIERSVVSSTTLDVFYDLSAEPDAEVVAIDGRKRVFSKA
jgi:hypothetical protein